MPPSDDAKSRVRDWFTKHAAAYTTDASQRAGADLVRVLELLAPASHETALDVATAAGHTALAMARFAKSVVAVDLTPAMREQFERNAEEAGLTNASFQVADSEALPFPDACFDLVTCRRAVHHFPDPARAAAELARVLRPGGRAGLVDMVAPEDAAAARLFNDLERARDASHVRALPASEFRRVFEAAGLRTVACELQPDRIPWVKWLSPESPGGPADLTARARLVAAPDHERCAVSDGGGDDLVFLKTRIVLVATR